jgi:hypothetical protein
MRKSDLTPRTGKPLKPSMTDAVNDGIATKLRALYSGFENEGIPENLLVLLDRLDEAERAYVNRDK